MPKQQEIIFRADDSQFKSVVDRVAQTISSAFNGASSSVEGASKKAQEMSKVIESQLSSIEKSGKGLFRDLLSDSERLGKSVKDRIEFLQKEITLIERASKEDKERAKLQERIAFEAKLKSAEDEGKPDEVKQKIRAEYVKNIADIEGGSKMDELQQRAMRQEFDRYKGQFGGDDGGGGGGGGGGTNIIGGAGRFSRGVGNAVTGAAGFGALLSVAGFIAKTIQEGEELSKAHGLHRGMIDTNKMSSLNAGIGGNFLGMKEADFIRYGHTMAVSSGTSRNLQQRSQEQLSFEKGFALDEGKLNSLSPALRAERGSRSAADVSLEMMNMFKKSKLFDIDKGDFIQIAEKLDFLNQMNQEAGTQMDRINATTSSQIIASFGSAGIDDNRLLSYTSSINRGISAPSDTFSNAITLRALRRRNPNMSLLELQEQQEQGIYGKGNFAAVLDELKGSFSGDLLVRSVASQFGLKIHQARKLIDSGEDFSRIGSKEDVEMLLGKDDVSSRGASTVTPLERRLSEFNTQMGEWGEKMLIKLDELITKIEEKLDLAEKDGTKDKMETVLNLLDPKLPIPFKSRIKGIQSMIDEDPNKDGDAMRILKTIFSADMWLGRGVQKSLGIGDEDKATSENTEELKLLNKNMKEQSGVKINEPYIGVE